jgi:hypothetical protein
MNIYIVTSSASDGTWIGSYTDTVIIRANDEHEALDIALNQTNIIGGREDLSVCSVYQYDKVIFENWTRD